MFATGVTEDMLIPRHWTLENYNERRNCTYVRISLGDSRIL